MCRTKMKQPHYILLGCFILFTTWTVSGASFLGGTATWITAPGNKVRLTYRTAWEKRTGPCGPACSPADIGSIGLSPELSSVQWISDTNNKTYTLSNVKYVVTSVSKRNMTGWEQGENTVMYDVLPSQKFTVKFLGFRWIPNSLSSQFPSIGLMSTRVDVRTRNDTGRPNSSPFTSLPAYFAVYFGCERTIRIPVSDPESDRVNCRLALETECGSACSDVPEGTIWVNEDKCTLTVYPFETVGYKPDQFYRITLVVEDFPDFPISLGAEIFTHKDSLSAIPFQISIRVIFGECDGHNATRFVSPTVPNFANAHYTEYDILRRQPFSTLLYIQVAYKENKDTTEVMMSGPMNVKYSYSEDDQSRSDVFRVNMTWVSEIPPQIGNQQFCIWAVSEDGFVGQIIFSNQHLSVDSLVVKIYLYNIVKLFKTTQSQTQTHAKRL